jgi:two-component system chemotaxis response regulator CheB
VAEEVVQKVKAAARSRRRAPGRAAAGDRAVAVAPAVKGTVDIVVLGISTGGPQGLKVVIPPLPADFPVPLAIVMHMPLGYTEMYAAKLNDMSLMRVVEAKEGDLIVPGTVFLAPAGRHLVFRQGQDGVTAGLELRPLDTPHRPAVDVLFQSAAEVYGARVLGIVMTGMGSDGREGAAWIKSRGGYILAEAEESCVVYGMPRSVVEAGLADGIIPLDHMAQAIMERV